MLEPVEKFVERRISYMRKAPQMWAHSIESYLFQVLLLAEIINLPTENLKKAFVNGNSWVGLNDPLTAEVATKIMSIWDEEKRCHEES